MRKIIYYVAASLDGYIAGQDDDISGFVQGGNGVEKYLNDLKKFDTVIMGRRTYEFGYKFGLKPGQLAYPHMKHYIFSNNLKFENAHPDLSVQKLDIEFITYLKNTEGSDIYLCGGGQFSNWLLKHKMIDEVKLKLNPFIQGTGIKMFGETKTPYQLELKSSEQFEHGLQIISYKVNY